MKFARVCIPLMLPLLLAVGLASAAEVPLVLPSDRPVTLQECIEYALAQHASVLTAERTLDSSNAEVTRARSAFMPQISMDTGYSGNGTSLPGAGSTTDYTGQSTFGISETFYDGGRTNAAIRQASASARAARAGVDLARQNRALAVTTAYFEALRTKRLADIAVQTVSQSEEQLKLIRAKVDAKDAAPVDVYPVDVQLANAKLSKLQEENSSRVAATALRNAVGLARGQELKLVEVSEPSMNVVLLDDCLTCGVNSRPEIVQSVAQVESAKAALNLAKLQALPIPTATAGFGRNLGGAGFDQKWSLGVGLSMHVFDGGASAASIKSAKARLESAEIEDAQLRKDISAEIEASYLNWTSALERLTASKTNVTLAKTNLDVAREKYQQGLAIPLEIVTAQVSYADAQSSNAQALYDCYIARAQLDTAMGKRGY